MKIIFLDIDGVLNTSETIERVNKEWKQRGLRHIPIDEFRVEYLKQIIDETGAYVVLSSNWREHYSKKDDKIIAKNWYSRELNYILNKCSIRIYDLTPNGSYEKREEQITSWLDEHDDIESFIILDDQSFNLIKFIDKELIKTSNQPAQNIKTSFEYSIGLSLEHIDIAINKLNKGKVKKLK